MDPSATGTRPAGRSDGPGRGLEHLSRADLFEERIDPER